LPQPPALAANGLPFIELQSVDSTNNYALAQAHAGLAQHGQAFFAHQQVAGKGQRGKQWMTEKNANITLSILLEPASLPVSAQFGLSAAVALAAHDFFSRYAGSDTTIKWPNDIYWQDRKAGGILIENIIGGKKTTIAEGSAEESLGGLSWQWAVAGIGININQTVFTTGLRNPVSLKQITGKNFDIIELAQELHEAVMDRVNYLLDGNAKSIHELYVQHLYKKNEIVKLRKDNRVFNAVVKTVSPDGQLIVRHGIEEALDWGTVEWVL
jgi:BirA family transcriptional regulator, biotin operon repressor / biotin---[acetyl-CoA-carboxylase] ligase